jgi:hypothetical protein
MEAFIIAIMLIAALAIGSEDRGTEDRQREDHMTHADVSSSSPVSPLSSIQTVDRDQSTDLCDPDRCHIRQRDLTVPLNQQSTDDEH